MNNWLKMGALALALGALSTLSGGASAEPRPGIITPPTKGGAPVALKGGDKGPPDAKGKPGEPIAKLDGKLPGPPEGAASAAASAAVGPAGSAAAPPLDEEKLKEIRAKAKARVEEHKAKVKEVRAEIKKKVEEKLKGQPMVSAMKEELKRHARRISRLERAKDLAQEANDAETVARVDKLIEKENARHDKWLVGFDAKVTVEAKDKAGGK